MTYAQLIVTVVVCCFLLAIGLFSLAWPERLQRYALKRCTRYYFWANPFLDWMKTRSYLTYLRVMGGVFLLAGAFVLLLIISVLAGERQESWSYSNLSEANKAGAITRGWVPDDILPASSRNIRVVGELSPSKEWCAFEFSPADTEILTKNLKSVESLPFSVRQLRSPSASWWPEVLTGVLDVGKIEKSGLRIYVVERPANSVNMGIYLFALDCSKGRGFFYWTYKS